MCKGCPWNNSNNHSIKFREFFKKINQSKKLEGHKCHLIDHDVWANKSSVNPDNICIGSIER
jgi:hypothetical protein